MIMNDRYRFGWFAVLLHWLLFLLIAGLVVSGKYSDSLSQTEKLPDLIATHKQVGVAVLLLMMFRLLWRLINLRPPSLSDSPIIPVLGFISHWLLYLVVIAQALGGVIMTQLNSLYAVTFLGWNLPVLVGEKGLFGPVAFILENKEQLRQWHEYGAHLMLALIALHVLAALAHHFYWSDETLRRMWFGYKPGYTRGSQAHRH